MPGAELDPHVGESDEEYEPPWGSSSWPRQSAQGLDEGDLLLIRSMLALTPQERLETLRGFLNGLSGVRRDERLRPG